MWSRRCFKAFVFLEAVSYKWRSRAFSFVASRNASQLLVIEGQAFVLIASQGVSEKNLERLGMAGVSLFKMVNLLLYGELMCTNFYIAWGLHSKSRQSLICYTGASYEFQAV